MKTVKRFIDLLDSDTRLNAGIALPHAIENGNGITPLQILRSWIDSHGRDFSERVEIADGMGSFSFGRADDDEGSEPFPDYVREIMEEWRATDPVPGPKDNTGSLSIIEEKYPLTHNGKLTGNIEIFLRAIMHAGVGKFPLGKSVFETLPLKKTEKEAFFSFLLPIQRLAVIDEEVYTVIKSLYIGIGQALFHYKKDLAAERKAIEDNGGKRPKNFPPVQRPVFSSAEDVVKMFQQKDKNKYDYLTKQHVAVWLRFVVKENDNDEIEWLRRFVIPTQNDRGKSTGERKILFMESAFTKLVEHFLA